MGKEHDAWLVADGILGPDIWLENRDILMVQVEHDGDCRLKSLLAGTSINLMPTVLLLASCHDLRGLSRMLSQADWLSGTLMFTTSQQSATPKW